MSIIITSEINTLMIEYEVLNKEWCKYYEIEWYKI